MTLSFKCNCRWECNGSMVDDDFWGGGYEFPHLGNFFFFFWLLTFFYFAVHFCENVFPLLILQYHFLFFISPLLKRRVRVSECECWTVGSLSVRWVGLGRVGLPFPFVFAFLIFDNGSLLDANGRWHVCDTNEGWLAGAPSHPLSFPLLTCLSIQPFRAKGKKRKKIYNPWPFPPLSCFFLLLVSTIPSIPQSSQLTLHRILSPLLSWRPFSQHGQ